jgi:hypothetical protein
MLKILELKNQMLKVRFQFQLIIKKFVAKFVKVLQYIKTHFDAKFGHP